MQDKLYFDFGGERAVAIGRYVAETGSTVRQAAAVFGVSKSTAHKDLVTKLKYENYHLYCRVEKNTAEKQAGKTYPWRYSHKGKISAGHKEVVLFTHPQFMYIYC